MYARDVYGWILFWIWVGRFALESNAMKKKTKKKPGRKRLIDGQASEFIGFFIPQSMRELIDIEASYNDLNLSRQMRKIITDYFEKEGDTRDN